MTERREEILKIAVDIIANEGYASLTMRALARASGMKLGALQYHFRTSEDLLRALVAYISDAYNQSFSKLQDREEPPSVREVVVFILDDTAGAISAAIIVAAIMGYAAGAADIRARRGPIRLLLLYLDQGLNT